MKRLLISMLFLFSLSSFANNNLEYEELELQKEELLNRIEYVFPDMRDRSYAAFALCSGSLAGLVFSAFDEMLQFMSQAEGGDGLHKLLLIASCLI